MKTVVIVGTFCVGFAARLLQLTVQASSMVGPSSPFEPFGDMWCLLSSCNYAFVAALIVFAIIHCDKKSSTTLVALFLAGSCLMADFVKPSRFEDGTCLDHAIRLVGAEHASIFTDQWSVAKGFDSLAKL